MTSNTKITDISVPDLHAWTVLFTPAAPPNATLPSQHRRELAGEQPSPPPLPPIPRPPGAHRAAEPIRSWLAVAAWLLLRALGGSR